MDIEYPVYVLLKDCNEVLKLSSSREWNSFEATDVENDEYSAWDAKGQKLALEVQGTTAWDPGTFTVVGSGETEDLNRFQEIVAISKERPLTMMERLAKHFGFVRAKTD